MSDMYILAVDQGTSGTKTVIFDSLGRIVAKATSEVKSYFPKVGFVEQDPNEIYESVLRSVKMCLDEFLKDGTRKVEDITCCGISNQRETFVLWDREGNPLSNAVVWQCKRSLGICERLKDARLEEEVRSRTGLIIDPYFSGTKLIWLYENDSKVRDAIDEGQAYFGTIDSWLLFKLTDGQSYLTDYTNASRTLLFNINDLKWDCHLLDRFNLSNIRLPEVRACTHLYGKSDFSGLLPGKITISAMIGDSHAAAFGEGCFSSGTAKVTMGTGSSILLNTGANRVESKMGMVATICWSTADRVDYALEGIIVTCGATVNWLRDKLGLFENSGQTEEIAMSVDGNNGVYLIPAFSGLGAPHWKMDARAAVVGLTFGCDKRHIVRAALESIAYQIKDVISAMEAESGIELAELKVDGGITANRFVMQFLADLLGTDVVNIGLQEVSALGAAYLAGLQEGIFSDIDQIRDLQVSRTCFSPGQDTKMVQASYQGWKKAIGDFCS